MDRLLIHGGVPLSGEVRISGAKNAALPIMCAALLSAAPLRLTNVPQLRDVTTLLNLLGGMGVAVSLDEKLGHLIDIIQPVERNVATREPVVTPDCEG